MSKSAYLKDEFKPRATVRGGILMFKSQDAIELIHEAQVRKLPILGIDSFILSETKAQPLYDQMLDLSRTGVDFKTNWMKATRFIEERKDNGFHFEIVIGDSIQL